MASEVFKKSENVCFGSALAMRRAMWGVSFTPGCWRRRHDATACWKLAQILHHIVMPTARGVLLYVAVASSRIDAAVQWQFAQVLHHILVAIHCRPPQRPIVASSGIDAAVQRQLTHVLHHIEVGIHCRPPQHTVVIVSRIDAAVQRQFAQELYYVKMTALGSAQLSKMARSTPQSSGSSHRY